MPAPAIPAARASLPWRPERGCQNHASSQVSGGTSRHSALASAGVVKMTVRLSARRQTATGRAGQATGNGLPHLAGDLDRQPGEHDAPSNHLLPGPGVVSTHAPPVPAGRRPALPREPGPPRADATPRPSPARAAGRHAPRPCHAERHLTTGVASLVRVNVSLVL